MNFAKLLRKPFVTEYFGWLLLCQNYKPSIKGCKEFKISTNLKSTSSSVSIIWLHMFPERRIRFGRGILTFLIIGRYDSFATNLDGNEMKIQFYSLLLQRWI